MSSIAIFTAVGLSALHFISLLFTPILLSVRSLGLHYYIVCNDDEKTRAITKVLQATAINSITMFKQGNYQPSGYFLNWKCAGYYLHSSSYNSSSVEIHMFTTESYFKSLIETTTAPVSFASQTKTATPPVSNSIDFFARTGSYSNLYYNRVRIEVHDLEPRGQQGEVVDGICESFLETRRGVYFIYGVSGAGKSTIGMLVASRLKGTFCHTFNPTDPGDTLHHLLRDSVPMDEHPTIIILEEVNTMIRAIHDGAIQKHKNVTTCIHNKITYNTFIDDLILYRNVMIIMTSNEDKDAIDTLDPCYLRKGRVHGYYSMMDILPMDSTN
jgi:hypothetical protein